MRQPAADADEQSSRTENNKVRHQMIMFDTRGRDGHAPGNLCFRPGAAVWIWWGIAQDRPEPLVSAPRSGLIYLFNWLIKHATSRKNHRVDDERGFGFVVQNGASARMFLHVSAFRKKVDRPLLGSLITYEIRQNENGRPWAATAELVGTKTIRKSSAGAFLYAMVGLALLLVLGYVGHVRLSNPNSTIPASAYKIVSAKDALKPQPEFGTQDPDTSLQTCRKVRAPPTAQPG
jgi:cold shock CspA family protein